MSASAQPILDRHGHPMFLCRGCRAALTVDDFFELGLRLPDRGESHEEYCDSELIDELEHEACARAARAG